ncbi:aminotransferase class I/II-fold pyridoxal phosphate-dependent enzyme [Halopiger xanaduensis]|uniref:DegT/DnrJ/EryC1/StrS aminotransferase n=1 Tax=Halopiger xanaduensis (strain DSM 18323 / JCM 14033 / SH-6) TaxID=797210 RepID=F8D5W2_HALXS|nr:aminotransferase class I/II-fold pyridoxal phosphate-dependent enzyme [Halopiger xanaduensis]AEH37688.1 DegT/DnrJ/EryC1/StrS aminotransferase [Halopiger xanaduensis SH-6]
MHRATPTLSVRSLASRADQGLEAVFDNHARAYTYYGSGKVALRDGLAGLVEPGQNVLIPAYLPDAVAEPFRDLDLEPRYYRVRPSFAPDFADLEARLDDETAAVMSVNYFGFPQPGLEEVAALADERGCYHIDDNAHAPISVANGRLLGTDGDIGITSLWKLLPIPNGAVLYRNSDAAVGAYEPTESAGVRDRVGLGDGTFLLKSTARTVLGGIGGFSQSLGSFLGDATRAGAGDNERRDAARDGIETEPLERDATEPDGGTIVEESDGDPPAVGTPEERYEEGKTPMAKLSKYVLENADPARIRERRRANYRTWRRILADRDDLAVVYDDLPEGICPQAFPVRADRPDDLVATFETRGVGAYTWPRLSATVRNDPAYETARRLSRTIVALPVHQHIEPSTLEEIGTRLSR